MATKKLTWKQSVLTLPSSDQSFAAVLFEGARARALQKPHTKWGSAEEIRKANSTATRADRVPFACAYVCECYSKQTRLAAQLLHTWCFLAVTRGSPIKPAPCSLIHSHTATIHSLFRALVDLLRQRER